MFRTELTNDILYKISKNILSRNSKFENLHKGESCYIIGNGSSIKYYDLDQFSDRVSIGCNQLFLHRDYSKLDLRYYYTGHPFFYYPYWTNQYLKKFEKNKIGTICRENILENNQIEYFISLSNFFGLRGNNINYVHYFDKKFDINNFKLNDKFTYMDGSLSAMLGIALYMGFKDIILVGCDYTWKPRHNGHFFEYGKRPEKLVTEIHSENSLLAANEYANLATITITNEYIGQVIPSLTYKDLTGDDLCYKENHEIISSSNLIKLNKTNMQYRIFDEE